MEYCINFARNKNLKKLVLYSNTLLENAIHIYMKKGFKEIPIEKNCPYKRSNIKMELQLIEKYKTIEEMDMTLYDIPYNKYFWDNVSLPPETLFYKKNIVELESLFNVPIEDQFKYSNQ